MPFKPKAPESNLKLQTGSSGKPAPLSNRIQKRIGGLPRKPFHSGDMGSPSSSTDVMASRLMQQVMEPDDVEYWEELEGNPPYKLDRIYIRENMTEELELLLREYIRENIKNSVMSAFEYELMEDEDLLNKNDEDDDEEEVEEMSVSGAVAGYSLPLGMEPEVPIGSEFKKDLYKRSKKKTTIPRWQPTADAFGGAKKV